MEAVLDVDKKYIDKPGVKRLEIEYGDMNYIIVNLDAKVDNFIEWYNKKFL